MDREISFVRVYSGYQTRRGVSRNGVAYCGDMSKTEGNCVRLKLTQELPIVMCDSTVQTKTFTGTEWDSCTYVFVAAKDKHDGHLVVRTEKGLFCMKIRPNVTTAHISAEFKEMVSDPHAFSVFVNYERVDDLSALTKLENLEAVDVVSNRFKTWSVVFRSAHNWVQHFTINCRSADTLTDIKTKLLDSHAEALKPFGVDNDLSKIWLTLRDVVLTNKLLNKERFSRNRQMYYDRPERDDSSLCLFIQPPDAVPVVVQFTPGDTPSSVRNTKTLIVSPQISHEDLRLEVSKVVGREPDSMKIIISRRKLHPHLDLKSLLSEPHCTIMVEPEKRILLDVCIVHVLQNGLYRSEQRFIGVFPNEVGTNLKAKISKTIGVHDYEVDLHFNGHLQADKAALSDIKFKDKDKLQAFVYIDRAYLRVRTVDRKWHNVLIDDCNSTTVRDLKQFIQSLPGHGIHASESEIVFTYKGRVWDDETLLSEVGVKRGNTNNRGVMIRVDTFTVDTARHGKLLLFRDSKSGCFQPELAMSDGKTLFYASPDTDNSAMIREFLAFGRWKSPLQNQRLEQPFKGLREYREIARVRQSGVSPTTKVNMSSSTSVRSVPSMPQQQSSLRSNFGSLRPGMKDSVGPPQKQNAESAVQSEAQVKPTGTLPSSTEAHRTSQNEADEGSFATPSEVQRPIQSAPSTCTREERKDQVAVRERTHTSTADVITSQVTTLSSRRETHSKTEAAVGLQQNRASLAKVTQEYSDSESDTGRNRRKFSRKTVTWECIEENTDNTWTYRHSSESEAVLPEDAGETGYVGMIQSKPSSAASSPTTSAALVPYKPLNIQPCSEPHYKYIKGEIIRTVARHLGDEGMMVMRELSVGEEIINSATAAYPSNVTERYLYCLNAWCKKFGSQASKDVLMKALRRYGRNDLVEEIESLSSTDVVSTPGSN